MNLNYPFIVLKLQELGLNITEQKLKFNRWTDVKHIDGHTYGYIINTNKNICSWLRRGTDEKGYFLLNAQPFNISNKAFKRNLEYTYRQEQKAYFDKATILAQYYFELQDQNFVTPYLIKKNVPKYNCKTDDLANLIIPLRILKIDKFGYTNSYIKTIQTIAPDGKKKLASGGQKKGAMGLINFRSGLLPKPSNKERMDKFGGPIIIAEGYATAATIAKITHSQCVMACDAGNMLEVIKQLRLSYPKAKLIIAADNDLKLRETIKGNNRWIWSNTGVEAAIKVQTEIDCAIAIPDFSQIVNNKELKLTDWNDLMLEVGEANSLKMFQKQV